jgi:hypothetical protein
MVKRRAHFYMRILLFWVAGLKLVMLLLTIDGLIGNQVRLNCCRFVLIVNFV